MKEVHQLCHVNHQKMLAQFHRVDQIHNVHVYPMELLNVHVCQVSLKVRILFAVVLNREVLVNHSLAVLELLVMLHEVKFAIAQKELLEIHSDNVARQLSLENCVNQDHAEVMF